MTTPEDGMASLVAAAESGQLDDLGRRYRIRVLTVFGSTGRGEPDPRDLDIGVLFERDSPRDRVGLYGELCELTGGDFDLGVINGASALFQDRALGQVTPIWESQPGAWIRASAEAAVAYMDTAWLARLNLESMARL